MDPNAPAIASNADIDAIVKAATTELPATGNDSLNLAVVPALVAGPGIYVAVEGSGRLFTRKEAGDLVEALNKALETSEKLWSTTTAKTTFKVASLQARANKLAAMADEAQQDVENALRGEFTPEVS